MLRVCEKIDKEFPVIKETYREILYDVMDLENAKEVLEKIKKGEIRIKRIKRPLPSPFAHGLIVLGDPDIVLMEDRKKRMLELYRAVIREIEKRESGVKNA